MRRQTGRDDEDVGVLGQRVAVAEPHAHADDVEHLGTLALALAVRGVDDGDARAEVHQVVGGSEAGDTDAGDDGVHGRPVRGAREGGDVRAAHGRRIHSA